MTDHSTGLEAELRSHGISVERLQAGDVVDLDYLTAFPANAIAHQEVGRACNCFIDLANDGRWEPTRVEATVLRSEDDVLGSWHLEPEWITGLNEYRLSEEDFSELVLETLEVEATA